MGCTGIYVENLVSLFPCVHARSRVTGCPYMMIDMVSIRLMDCEVSTPFHQREKI
jgi:hypothetical protein